MGRNNRGFTIVEVLVALSLTGIVMTAIYTTYISQQKSYSIQSQIGYMQQNLRAALQVMTGELRMAGYDPKGTADAKVVSLSTSPAAIRFTADLNADGDTDDANEDITYSVYTSDGVQQLGRKNPDVNMSVAEHVEILDLVFLDADNNATANPDEVRSIQVTIVAKTSQIDNFYSDQETFRNLQGTTVLGPEGDGFRRMLLAEQVKCRNLGI
jgi:type IV pilus assembly protein PilW